MIEIGKIRTCDRFPCRIETSYYMPIKFESYDELPGCMDHIRFGDLVNSLLDIELDPNSHQLRGFTVVSISRAQIRPILVLNISKATAGLPEVYPPKEQTFAGQEFVPYMNIPKDFTVGLGGDVIQIGIDDLMCVTEKISFGRVDFLTDSKLLLGFQVNNLTADEKGELAHFFDGSGARRRCATAHKRRIMMSD